MKLKFLVFLMFGLFVSCTEVDKNNPDNGILYPHIDDSNFVYIGKINNYYIYSAKDFQRFEDGNTYFSTIVVSEDFGYIIKNPVSHKYAVQGFDEVDTLKINFNINEDDNLYSEIWRNTVAKNWNKNYSSRKLKNDELIYPVTTNYSDDMAHLFYVPIKFENYNSNHYLFFAMQIEERYSIVLDIKNNSYSTAKCDYFWNPIEQKKKREIKANDIATALIKYFGL